MKTKIQSFKSKPKWSFRWNFDWEWGKKLSFLRSYSLRTSSWKDKFDTPRCERVPYFYITFLGLCLTGERGTDEYWEKWLWIHKYYDGDENEAREQWPWVIYETDESTWFKD